MTILSNSSDVHVKIKGFKIFKDRHGKPRCYHRASGEAVDLIKFPFESTEFLGECGRISALTSPNATPRPGSLGLLIKEFRASQQWQELKPKTREWYEMGFEYLRPISDTSLLRFKPSLVVKIRDKAFKKKGWYFANLVKTTLSMLFAWGVERDYLEFNPAKQIKKIKRPKQLARANRPWTKYEREIVLAEADAHTKPVLGALLYVGFDPCDAVRLSKAKYNGEAFDFSRQKTGNPVWKPAPKALKKIIAEMPVHDAITLFANSYGNPWTKSGFDSYWHKFKKSLEERGLIERGLTLKGLRHTHATMLRESGASHGEVADALGDKSESMGRWYSRDADLKAGQSKVIKAFDKQHEFVKPLKKSVKP